MDRRKFVGMVGAGIAGAAIPASAAATEKVAQRDQDERPNFVFMIADDMTYRLLGSINNPEVHTPNLDRLASRGCAFTHCFQQGSWMPAVCAPSRTMLNSGLSAFHAKEAAQRLSSFQPNDIDDMQSVLLPATIGMPKNAEIEKSLDDYPVWGQTLREAGYDTFLCGKWHQDPVSLSRAFSEVAPVGPGMYRSTGLEGSAYHRPKADGSDSWNAADRSLRGHWVDPKLVGNAKSERIVHSAQLYADHVVEYVERKHDKPFFVYLGWNSPHDPRQAPQEYLDMYPVDKVKVPPNFLPEHPFNEGDHRVRDEQLAPWPRTPHMIQVHRREYYAIVSHMDAQIGRIMDAVEKSGQAHNTYIIMAGDHGLCVGEHGLLGKQNVYDASIRMPLIIAGPKVPAGRRVDELVYQHSMYATTCELAGVETPKHVEFPSLAGLATGTHEAPVYDSVFSYYKSYVRTVRTKKHKLTVYPEVKVVQLFEIDKDPWEMHNRADDPAMAHVKEEMWTRLNQWQHKLDDTLDIKTAADYPAQKVS